MLQCIKVFDLKSLIFGVRWDVGVNVVFKVEVSYYQGGVGIFIFELFFESVVSVFDEWVNLY